MTDAVADQEVLDWLWIRLSELRDRGGRPDASAVLRLADEAGIHVGWKEATWLVERAGFRGHPSTPRARVVEFVRLYLAGRGAELAVDPACTTPALLLALVDGDIAHRGLGLMRDPGLGEAVAAAARNGRLQWASDWWVAPLPDKPGPIGQPSLIVSLPPTGMPVTKGRYPRPDGGVVTVGDP
jgi:hypothetical protein